MPHLAFPLSLSVDGTFRDVEQDTLADVRQCVHALARTQRGSRPLSPQAGLEDVTFDSYIDPEVIEGELEEQEPRAEIEVEVATDAHGEAVVRINVGVVGDDSPDEDEVDYSLQPVQQQLRMPFTFSGFSMPYAGTAVYAGPNIYAGA